MGLDNKSGSIETGKSADLLIWEKSPFDHDKYFLKKKQLLKPASFSKTETTVMNMTKTAHDICFPQQRRTDYDEATKQFVYFRTGFNFSTADAAAAENCPTLGAIGCSL